MMDFEEREKTENAVRGIATVMKLLPFFTSVIGGALYFVLKGTPVLLFSTPFGEIFLHHFVVIILLINIPVAYGILSSIRSNLEKKLEIS